MAINEPNTDITILVVDDDPEILFGTTRILKKEGYHVLSTSSGSECISLAKKHIPDLVLLDVVLPDADGRNLCKDLKSDPLLKEMHIILISGLKTSSEDQAEAIEMGADDYLTRPISNREIRARINVIAGMVKNEKELKDSENRYRSLFELMEEGFLRADMQGNITMANMTIAKMCGYDSPEEMIGLHMSKLYADPKDRETMRLSLKNNGVIHNHEILLQTKADTHFWSSSNIKVLKDEHGNSLGTEGLIRNISDLKLAEEALRKSETLHREAQHIAKIGHWELDSPSGKPVWSDGIYHIFGLDPQKSEPSFAAHKNIIHEEDWDLLQKSIEELNTNGTPFDIEYRILQADGKIGWMHAIGSAEKNKDGHVERMFGIAQDITKNKQSEKSLLHSNEIFKRTESIAHIGSWEWDILPDCVRWSDELFRIFGRDPSADAPSWADHQELYVAEDMQRLRHVVEICVNQGTPYEIGLCAIRTDGEIRYCVARGRAQTDENGKIIRLIGSFQDITEYKHAEKKLQESEEKYRLIAENMADIITTMDMDLNFTYVSPSIIKLRGFTVEEALQQTIDQIMTPESFQRASEAFAEELRLEESGTATPDRAYIIELEEYKKDGSVIWVENTVSFIRDNDEKPVGIMVVSRDITDRKMAETEIILQKNKAEQYLHLAGVMFIGLDADGKVNIANEKAREVLECSETEIIRQDWFDNFIPQNIRSYVRSVFKQLVAGKVENVEYYENPVISKKGKEKLISWHNTMINDENGKITGILGSGEDITEKKELEKRLIQAQKMEAIGTLAGGIAHDFNNILSSVIGFTELALDDVEKGSSIEDSLQEIYSGGKRARDLVKQILAFARQSDEAMKLIQIDVIAREALKLLRASIPTTIQINQNIEKNLTIMGNSTQVHQIIMNLCTNAAQAMEDDGGVLEISIKEVVIDRKNSLKDLSSGEYAEIEISDTGMGIDPGVMNKIFDPYFTTKETGKGSGMGLALVHGIIETYNGMITVDSLPAKGSVFKVYLPLIRSRTEPELYQPEILPVGDERILLVDDEKPILRMTSQILQKLGYEVVFRDSSMKALELFRSNPEDFDLVITDMTMPDMTGDKLAVESMKIRPDIPVILCTGYSNRISDKTATTIGIKAFAYKPFSKADLAKTIRKVLDEAKGKTQQ